MEQTLRRVISGQQTGWRAALLRGTLRLVEPIYTTVTSSRNGFYSSGIIAVRRARRPVVSIGNITTGGTGKTPAVRWLAERLRASGFHPAVLMRGYRSRPGESSDEQQLLDDLLNPPGTTTTTTHTTPPTTPTRVIVHADPDRFAGSEAVLRDHPDVDLFILDDGFQHRRLRRDFDLVLIDTTSPFGYDHVLPRGLLREPVSGLARASAILLTRVDQALPGAIEECEQRIRQYARAAPIYRSRHAHAAIVCDENGRVVSLPIQRLHAQRVFAFCGIGNPEAFERQLSAAGASLVGCRAFGDHHDYSAADVATLQRDAVAAGAAVLLTTEKDWVKLARLARAGANEDSLPIWRVRLEMQFVGTDEARLLEQLTGAIETAMKPVG